MMSIPQPGIFALGTRAHHHLEFDLSGPHDGLLDLIAGIREAANSVAGVNVVVGFGAELWARLVPGEVPDGATAFTNIVGADGFTMPAAQHDLWLWLHGAAVDAVLDVARSATSALSDRAELVAEQVAFVYRSSQDLTGFEDGTENPPVHEAATIATIPAGSPCAGGSIALLQRWVHHLDLFEAMDLADREQVFGRTLAGSVELAEDVMSPRSHVARVVIEDADGDELEVWRRSTAFGNVRDHGLMFVAFSADRDRLQRMLERMAGSEDGVRDHLTDYSTPTASAWYVVPPVDGF